MGVLSDFKVDFKLIYDVALARPDWHWVIIGTEREGQKSEWIARLQNLTNIHFLGRKAYRDLPNYLGGCQVATLPTLCNDYTRSMFPMKFYEYIAAGLRVVSTPLQFVKGITVDEVKIAHSSVEFERHTSVAIPSGRLSDKDSQRLIGANTWEARLKTMLITCQSA